MYVTLIKDPSFFIGVFKHGTFLNQVFWSRLKWTLVVSFLSRYYYITHSHVRTYYSQGIPFCGLSKIIMMLEGQWFVSSFTICYVATGCYSHLRVATQLSLWGWVNLKHQPWLQFLWSSWELNPGQVYAMPVWYPLVYRCWSYLQTHW